MLRNTVKQYYLLNIEMIHRKFLLISDALIAMQDLYIFITIMVLKGHSLNVKYAIMYFIMKSILLKQFTIAHIVIMHSTNGKIIMKSLYTNAVMINALNI